MDWSLFWTVMAQLVLACLILVAPVSLFVSLVIGGLIKVISPPVKPQVITPEDFRQIDLG